MNSIHHIAYRCRDAQETTDFYVNIMGFPLITSLLQETVPSIQKLEPHIHIFFRMDDGACLAFFDTLDNNDPLGSLQDDWAQHLAFNIESHEKAKPILDRLKSAGVEIMGPTDHVVCESYYFRDPSGHRLELAIPTDQSSVAWAQEMALARPHLQAWNERKKGHKLES